MNKYISNILAGSMAVMSLAACSSDFLETTPTSSIATSTVFSTTENIKMAINGIALQMYTQYGAWSQGYCGENRIKSIYNEYPSQEFRYNVFAPGWTMTMNGKRYSQNTTVYCNYPWAYYYGIISSANSIIANVDAATGLDTEKLFYKAQALTFRAYAYEKLLELYTPRWQDTNNGAADGVVLRLDESTGSMPLSTVAECYAQIYQDLDDAVSYFKESGLERASGEVWLTNINTAYAIYARAALNRQDYSTALAKAKLAEEGYPLMSNAEYAAGFCKPTSEWIFGSYDDATENKWYWTFGTQFACNGYYANNTYYGAGDIEKELTDRMPTNDARMACFLTADKFDGIDFYDGSTMNLTYGYMVSAAARQAAKAYVASRTPSGLEEAYQYGYYYLNGQLKFWVFDTPGVAYVCHIRTSEMVLIEAEANYFLGKEADAIAALVRLNKTSGRNPEYSCSKSGDELFQEIVDYRELELWGEGFNWYDLKRWNRGITRKSFAEGGNCHTATAITISADSSDWTWAIPETEYEYNTEVSKN
jgi:hypothetical protein